MSRQRTMPIVKASNVIVHIAKARSAATDRLMGPSSLRALSSEGRRRLFDHAAAVCADLSKRLQEFRVRHAGADIGPTIGLMLHLDKARPLIAGERSCD